MVHQTKNTYIIVDNEVRGDGKIRCKIGQSQNARNRMKQLRGANPGHLQIAYVATNGYTEREMHDLYADLRITGEWFSMTPSQFANAVASLAYADGLDDGQIIETAFGGAA